MEYDPYEHAEKLGINVIHRKIRSANGLWLPDHRTIVLREGMRAVWDRCTLAHEIAHADLGHRKDEVAHEVAADRYAATRLIRADRCWALLAWAPDAHTAAAELGVTTRLLQVYLNAQTLAA